MKCSGSDSPTQTCPRQKGKCPLIQHNQDLWSNLAIFIEPLMLPWVCLNNWQTVFPRVQYSHQKSYTWCHQCPQESRIAPSEQRKQRRQDKNPTNRSETGHLQESKDIHCTAALPWRTKRTGKSAIRTVGFSFFWTQTGWPLQFAWQPMLSASVWSCHDRCLCKY